jgi:uncharacterized membrane protein
VATLTVLKFPSAGGADAMLSKLEDLQRRQVVKVEDAAIVSWPEGEKKPKTRHLGDMTGLGALDGAFWGMLFGLIFFVPFFGMAVGAAMGAMAGHFANFGIDKSFIEEMRARITEGTSALFLMTSQATVDRLASELQGMDFEIVSTSLSQSDEQKLRDAFSRAA